MGPGQQLQRDVPAAVVAPRLQAGEHLLPELLHEAQVILDLIAQWIHFILLIDNFVAFFETFHELKNNKIWNFVFLDLNS